MELQTIDMQAVADNFAAWKIHNDALQSATTSLNGLGDKPDLPQFVDDVAADYDAAITARNTWETNKKAYEDAIASRTALKEQQRALLIEKLPPNTWVKINIGVDPSDDWYWIGYNTNDTANYVPPLQVSAGSTQPATPLTHNMDA